MYLSELTREQQQAFLVMARQVINADERLAMQEFECLEAIYRELDISPETAEAPDIALDLNYAFDTPRSRAVAFIELLLVAYADGSVDDAENEKLSELADVMEISDEMRTDAHSWVKRFLELRRQGKVMGSA